MKGQKDALFIFLFKCLLFSFDIYVLNSFGIILCVIIWNYFVFQMFFCINSSFSDFCPLQRSKYLLHFSLSFCPVAGFGFSVLWCLGIWCSECCAVGGLSFLIPSIHARPDPWSPCFSQNLAMEDLKYNNSHIKLQNFSFN